MTGWRLGGARGWGARGWLQPALILAATLALGACATTRPVPAPSSSPAITVQPGIAPPHIVEPPAEVVAEEAVAAVPPGPRRILISRAVTQLGEPYRWGGNAPGGFDCSGLVVYAAGGAGIHLPRTTRELIHAGTPIRRGQVEAGDLVFLRLAHRQLHVGIALDNARFIHAPATGGAVRIDSLASTPYVSAFLTARRVVTD